MAKKKLSPKLRNFLVTVFFVILNIVIIVMTATSEFGNSTSAADLSEIQLKWWFLIPATLCFVLSLIVNFWRYKIIFKKMAPKESAAFKRPWKIAAENTLIGRYYDNITPAAIGGQPAQIVYLHKNGGLSTGQATAIPIYGMISLQITFIIIALLCFIFGGFQGGSPALMIAAWAGLLFNAFWPVLTFLSIISPKITTQILSFLIKLLAKIKIVKDRNSALEKAEAQVREYSDSVKMIFKRRELLPSTMLCALFFNLLTSAIPFFVLTAFGGNVDFIKCFILTVAVQSAVYFIPTPGNSGAAEGTFFVVFSALSSGYIFWAMLVWRFFSFYIYIILGWVTHLLMKLEKTTRKEEPSKLEKIADKIEPSEPKKTTSSLKTPQSKSKVSTLSETTKKGAKNV